MSELKEPKEGTPFAMAAFECPSNGMHGMYQWTRIRTRLDAVRQSLLAEVEQWRQTGAEQTELLRAKHDASVTSCIHHLNQQEERIKLKAPDGASVGPMGSNACDWEATIFGPSDSDWDGGMFSAELVFPPDFPESPPYVRYTTPVFHPQISPSGVPYLRSLLMWHCCEPKERTIASLIGQLIKLLKDDPSPEPATHLNLEAANLRFSRSEADRMEYKKRVKRCVQRSVDG